MSFDTIIQNLIERKPKFKKIYTDYDIYSEVSNLITAARIHYNLSQEKLAKLTKTEQPSIARLESGKFLPSVTSLNKIAKALGTSLIIRFGFMEEEKTLTYSFNVLSSSYISQQEKNSVYAIVPSPSKGSNGSASVVWSMESKRSLMVK